MSVSQKLSLRQSQSLVMTPQLQQAIKLLQLSTMELGQYIERELETNPVLERDESQRQDGDAIELDTPKADTSLEGTSNELALGENPAQSVEAMDQAFAQSESTDVDVGAGVAFENWGNGSLGASGFDDLDWASNIESQLSLRDHLASQINIEFDNPLDRLIAGQLAEGLDENGYLKTSLHEVAERLNSSLQNVERVLARVQAFDPAGIFARDLAECLKLQLIDQGRWDTVFQTLTENLNLVADGDLKSIAKLSGVPSSQIVRRIAELRTLQPKPTSEFDIELIQTVIPDVVLRSDAKGDWVIELNSHALPKLIVNNSYSSLVKSSAAPNKEREYFVDKYQSANWLVKALD